MIPPGGHFGGGDPADRFFPAVYAERGMVATTGKGGVWGSVRRSFQRSSAASS